MSTWCHTPLQQLREEPYPKSHTPSGTLWECNPRTETNNHLPESHRCGPQNKMDHRCQMAVVMVLVLVQNTDCEDRCWNNLHPRTNCHSKFFAWPQEPSQGTQWVGNAQQDCHQSAISPHQNPTHSDGT